MDTYSARISSASPLSLLIITYELFLKNIAKTKEFLSEGNNEKSKFHINHCQKLLNSCITSLNLDYEPALEVLPIYMYINRILIECQIKSNRTGSNALIESNLEHIEKIINILLDGVTSLPDTDVPVGQQVYAGLTYQKDGNLTEYIPINEGNEYQA